jgi:hypothetical protein
MWKIRNTLKSHLRDHRDYSLQQKTLIYFHLISIILLSTLETDMAVNPWMYSSTRKSNMEKSIYNLLLSNTIGLINYTMNSFEV